MSNMEKYVLITGASSGIGREISVQISQQYNLIIHGRDRQKLESVKQDCNQQSVVMIWQNDFNDVENIEISLKEFIKASKISVSAFVHSAGYMKMLTIKATNLKILNETMNINLYSAILISKVLANKVVNGSDLSGIVFISSNISNFGSKAFSAYAASKSALDGFMRCLAVELAPNVRVNSVLPGGVRTAMTEAIYENLQVIERMKAQYPLGLGETSDIANAVSFLLSEQSRWVTGQQITVDGGRTINITG